MQKLMDAKEKEPAAIMEMIQTQHLSEMQKEVAKAKKDADKYYQSQIQALTLELETIRRMN